jgi:starvation-inducible outer membrane lipoprotein
MKSTCILFGAIMLLMMACSSEPKPAETTLSPQEQQAVEDRMKQDQAAMDSLEKALMEKISADSISE